MKVLILNSAHGKYPSGKDRWIQATVKLIDTLARDNVTLICSTEPSPWDLVTYLAGKHTLNAELIVKSDNNEKGEAEFSHILSEYNLYRTRTQPLYLEKTSDKHTQPKELWRIRDRIAVSTADVIYPVSIRPGGRLDQLINLEGVKPKIRNEFRIIRNSEGYKPGYVLEGRGINPLPGGEWLVHWTRASQGPWPGETAGKFYSDLLENPAVYVRSAMATLARIFEEQLVRGSSWKMSHGERAAAFTSLSIEDAVPLMRWRKRYVRYTFEPYGIAVRRSSLAGCGARPVTYEQDTNVNAEVDRLYTHAPGKITDWTQEKEWRVSGDISLERIDRRDLIALVPDLDAKIELRKKSMRDIHIHVIFSE